MSTLISVLVVLGWSYIVIMAILAALYVLSYTKLFNVILSDFDSQKEPYINKLMIVFCAMVFVYPIVFIIGMIIFPFRKR
jgi:hypothetical protein